VKKNILLLESVAPEAMHILEENTHVFPSDSPFSGAAIAEKMPIHAIVTRGKGDVSQALIQDCPNLEVIARCGVGLDNIDVNYATKQGVRVVNAPGSNAGTVAEHTLALMLMLQRNLYNSVAATKGNNWNFRVGYQGDEIRGKTLGILGLGDIGTRVAQLASAFGMQVLYWNKTQKETPYQQASLAELFQQSDVLSLHLPLTEETKHLLDEKAFAQMQAHALIINTARGAIIEKSALVAALQNNQIAGFAADVLDIEPPASDDPLLDMSNVLITPHSASLTATTYTEMCVLTAQNTVDLLNNKSIDNRYIFNQSQLS
jgi:D-3-phosphoglycerate dehydrogenase